VRTVQNGVSYRSARSSPSFPHREHLLGAVFFLFEVVSHAFFSSPAVAIPSFFTPALQTLWSCSRFLKTDHQSFFSAPLNPRRVGGGMVVSGRSGPLLAYWKTACPPLGLGVVFVEASSVRPEAFLKKSRFSSALFAVERLAPGLIFPLTKVRILYFHLLCGVEEV